MITRTRWLPIPAAVLAALLFGGSRDLAAAPDNTPEYLALGDSLAFGIGASDPDAGYVTQVHNYLRQALDPGTADPPPLGAVPDAFNARFLGLANLGVGGPGAPPGGETTATMIAGGQLAAAVA